MDVSRASDETLHDSDGYRRIFTVVRIAQIPAEAYSLGSKMEAWADPAPGTELFAGAQRGVGPCWLRDLPAPCSSTYDPMNISSSLSGARYDDYRWMPLWGDSLGKLDAARLSRACAGAGTANISVAVAERSTRASGQRRSA